MTALLFGFRWVLLIVLLWGATYAVSRLTPLKPCYSPIVTLCSIALTVYFGGLLGLLQPITYLLIVLCVFATGWSFLQVKQTPFEFTAFPFTQIFFLLGTLAFGWILCQESLTHYDNFTHWALVVKEMLITNAFPTADSALIEFTNYPTGSASWIYFVCTVVGNAENSMIMAQGLLIFAALYSVFGIIEEKGRFLLPLTLGAGLSLLTLFNYEVRINDLLVDFLLPVLTLAAISLIYSHRKTITVAFLGIIPIVGLLVVIKSTGVIFACIAFIYLIFTLCIYSLRSGIARKATRNTRALFKMWGLSFLAMGCSLLSLIGWNIHTSSVFADVENKFETDLSLVSSSFGGKTESEIYEICQLFWQTITDISQRATIGIILFQVLAMIACVIACVVLKKKWNLPRVLVSMDAVLIAYLLGILAMYIFSMPMEEASYLAAFDRYSSSIVVLFGGTLAMCLTVDMERTFYYRVGEVDEIRSFKTIETKKLYQRGCIACVVVIALVLTSEFSGMAYQEELNEASLSQTVKEIVGDNWSDDENEYSYLVIANDDEGMVTNYYLYYVSQYYLYASNVDTICLFYEDNFLPLLSQYDYLVIIESSYLTQNLMQEYFSLSGQPGIYDVSDLL